ncbi:acetamidase/formamidase family protein [Oscillochloris sp. ZM17-4]|uniref:acetamidase/formamidase family protein n=1 Tax=Oscillochloris sp. ZM17-4 TaxID=2866714 RepID=UPI001C73C33C|nr:acetamidase/formamidase family protein [Oscillochloris sp. ZM17-4]MBX0328593.1 acetamidase/formamidase family protein [Oscillochloris sp. ZM17-4]
MATHILAPSRATLHGQLSADLPPALVIASGDTVRCQTLDVSWGLEARRPDGWRRTFPKEPPRDDGPALLGPIAVAGARPGQALEIHIAAVVPGPYGWTFGGEIGFFNTALNAALGVADGPPELLRWELDAQAMLGVSHLGHRVRLRPFLGTLGLCPAGEGWQPAWPPRRTGGNLDCKELVAGTTLYLPVEVPGGLISLGDGHAAQGDGEAAGNGIECPMDMVELRVALRDDLALAGPRANTPAGWVTFGFSADLDAAIAQALNAMLDLAMERFGLSRKLALALLSAAADVRLTQLVNGVRGAHVLLPHDAIWVDGGQGAAAAQPASAVQ